MAGVPDPIASLIDVRNTACDLKIEEKDWVLKLFDILRDAGIDVPPGLDRKAMRSFERIEDKWRYARINGCFARNNNQQYEVVWTHFGPLYTRDSPEFFVPQNLNLTEVVYHLTTAATTTGPTIKVYKNTTELDSEALGTNATSTVTLTPTAYTADTDELRWSITNVGDGTARNLVCIARFE